MRVHIKVSDRGWILEKMAATLAGRLDYVRYDLNDDPRADIQYYLTYATRRRRICRAEIAYFTHQEDHPSAQDRFMRVAKAVDRRVCMSALYAEKLRRAGCASVDLIPPGVDLDKFTPVVRIGVIGRTYYTGRKGEHLLLQVMDIPGIEWHFTGEGWPGPAQNLTPDQLPDFYRNLDYVLVPSLIEGGPMCVIEALACGVEVIAPPVGWVPELPHLEFRTGDATDLRRVLLSVVEKKLQLRRSVLDRSWDGFVTAHDRLFREVAGTHRIGHMGSASAPEPVNLALRVQRRLQRLPSRLLALISPSRKH